MGKADAEGSQQMPKMGRNSKHDCEADKQQSRYKRYVRNAVEDGFEQRQ
jgi:hypothetical protein